MSDENEFEDDGLDSTFDDFAESSSAGNKDGLKNKPIVKIGMAVGALVAIFLVINLISGGDEMDDLATSNIGASPSVTVAPGTADANPEYIRAIEEQNETVRENAEASGTSAIPVPIEPPVGMISVPDEESEEEDPLQRWRRIQEERLQKEIRQRETIDVVTTEDVKARAEVIQELSSLMQEQMSSILGAKPAASISTLNVTDSAFLDALREKREGGDEDGDETSSGDSGSGSSSSNSNSFEDEFEEEIIEETLLPAGEVVYAQLLTEANSDVPGPVLARVVSGPFKGSRILGRFKATDDYLVLNFDTLVYNEKSLGVDGIGLDPETTLPGVATSVNRHYMKRLLLPAAAAFIEGFSSALAEGGTTNITIDTGGGSTASTDNDLDSEQEVATGVQEVGQELRGILTDMADGTEPTIRIAAGTPVGILFTQPVVNQFDGL
ncbi:MAG: hypothetical protein KTR28_02055 [Micavibrio sp.]|nr:hypothetical protein [Micavibrio sp.]